MTEVAEENQAVVLNHEEMEEGEEEESSTETATKKETFQWNTPADEFAEDVASDVEEESEDENGGENDCSAGNNQVIEATHFSEVTNGQVDVKPLKPKSEGSGKKSKAKNQFPCPKCNKVWNWPWELRRHLVMHFKEVLLLCYNLTFKNLIMRHNISARSSKKEKQDFLT